MVGQHLEHSVRGAGAELAIPAHFRLRIPCGEPLLCRDVVRKQALGPLGLLEVPHVFLKGAGRACAPAPDTNFRPKRSK